MVGIPSELATTSADLLVSIMASDIPNRPPGVAFTIRIPDDRPGKEILGGKTDFLSLMEFISEDKCLWDTAKNRNHELDVFVFMQL
ncbi:Brefeldin A-Inhibited Guanine Nucleotide-Exchange Protein 1 [Manis pentadactyla]|nr:Brefeldin A-Inhibited Guanine Nucleotide-Exchange Protein 1 [Manis pentadactyla]